MKNKGKVATAATRMSMHFRLLKNQDFAKTVLNQLLTDVLPFAVPVSTRRSPLAERTSQGARRMTAPPAAAAAGEGDAVEALADEEEAEAAAGPGETRGSLLAARIPS